MKHWMLFVAALIVAAYCIAGAEDHRRPAANEGVRYVAGR